MTSPTTTVLALASMLAIGSALAAACSTQPTQGRFPVCKTEQDCADKPGIHCFDLRCVECRADGDCKAGSVCNQAKECESLGEGSAVRDQDGGSDAAVEPVEKETWESSTPADQQKCLAACKGKGAECQKRCGGASAPKK